MESNFIFSPKSPKDFINKISGKYIFNFENMNGLYYFCNLREFREAVSSKNSINFIDSAILFFYTKLKNKMNINRNRGPTFTRSFLSKSSKDDKHFFIGIEEKDISMISEKFPNLSLKNLYSYNPTFIKEFIFDKKEVEKIAKLINKSKPNYIWVCVGSPKQSILSYQLFKRTREVFFFNVGAAMDFIIGRKKESPKIFQNIGLEWLYRLATDFNNSKKKVIRSFMAIRYLNRIRVK